MMDRSVTFSLERLGALSDGVFAIILTLLVLELKIPQLTATHSEQEMLLDLERQIPSFAAWIISFVLVARIWIVHHAILARLARCHIGTITINFVLLGFCSLVPFGAGLIGTYEWDPLAIIIFSGVFAATGFSLGLLARHAERESSLHRPDAAPVDLNFHWRYHALGIPGVALASVLMIPIHEVVSLGLWLMEPAVAAVSSWKWSRRR